MGARVRHGRSLGDGWPSSAAFSMTPLETQHTGGISLKLGSSWRQLGASWSRLGVVLVLSWRPFSSSPARCAVFWLLGPSFSADEGQPSPRERPCRTRAPKTQHTAGDTQFAAGLEAECAKPSLAPQDFSTSEKHPRWASSTAAGRRRIFRLAPSGFYPGSEGRRPLIWASFPVWSMSELVGVGFREATST